VSRAASGADYVGNGTLACGAARSLLEESSTVEEFLRSHAHVCILNGFLFRCESSRLDNQLRFRLVNLPVAPAADNPPQDTGSAPALESDHFFLLVVGFPLDIDSARWRGFELPLLPGTLRNQRA